MKFITLLLIFAFVISFQVKKTKGESDKYYSHIKKDNDISKDFFVYQKLENALLEKLKEPNYSSHSKDYMKSTEYTNFKSYIHNHSNCITLLFNSFLIKSERIA